MRNKRLQFLTIAGSSINHREQVKAGKTESEIRPIPFMDIDIFQFEKVLIIVLRRKYNISQISNSRIEFRRSRRKCWCKGDTLAPV